MISNPADSKTNLTPRLHSLRRKQYALGRPVDFIRAAKLHDMMPVSALRMRERHLKQLCNQWQWFANNLDGQSAEMALNWLEEDGAKLIDIQDMIANLESFKDRSNGITDEMIAIAKSVPVDSLIEFRRGKCHAFCHEDKNPSMFHGTRLNLACCPVCDRKFDSIAILTERDGMSFVDAVKFLNGR